MASFAEMLQQYTGPPASPAPETSPEREPWDIICDRWPPLSLPKPPEPLRLDWLWTWLLLESMPSCPDGPGSQLANHVSYERWHRIEACYERGGGLPEDRLAWLHDNEEAIRPLLETAKAEHFARYPIRR